MKLSLGITLDRGLPVETNRATKVPVKAPAALKAPRDLSRLCPLRVESWALQRHRVGPGTEMLFVARPFCLRTKHKTSCRSSGKDKEERVLRTRKKFVEKEKQESNLSMSLFGVDQELNGSDRLRPIIGCLQKSSTVGQLNG
jgi:hypothetical protein